MDVKYVLVKWLIIKFEYMWQPLRNRSDLNWSSGRIVIAGIHKWFSSDALNISSSIGHKYTASTILLFSYSFAAHLNLGLCLWHQGKHDIAEQVFRHCLLLDSAGLKIPRGHRTAQAACAYNLGVMLAKLYRHSDAIVAYTKVCKVCSRL